MKAIRNIGLQNVQAVYSGPEGDLWELVMGEQEADIVRRRAAMAMQGAGGTAAA